MNNNKNQRDGGAETDIKSKRGFPFEKDQEDERRAKGAYPFFGLGSPDDGFWWILAVAMEVSVDSIQWG
ncbi:hypothetical protein FH972_008432 [Carpinus fangiana]|uniref:Uncharacterized protein n=1 Tax=Carpinus fangiana TaxID=176857 RepID=A0A5N6QYQ6_9ROSI|nr:hypothetical protein FH972_008432 [Carpinus fangiana]